MVRIVFPWQGDWRGDTGTLLVSGNVYSCTWQEGWSEDKCGDFALPQAECSFFRLPRKNPEALADLPGQDRRNLSTGLQSLISSILALGHAPTQASLPSTLLWLHSYLLPCGHSMFTK